jgi:hypothetical protein
MVCSKCGNTVRDPQAHFCAFCGNPMQAETKAATPSASQSPAIESGKQQGSGAGPALLVPARCSVSRQPFLIRMTRANPRTWTAVAASPIAEGRLRNPELQRAEANGRLRIAEEYDGCPYCKRRCIFLHSDCGGRLCCCDLNADLVVCPWCGSQSKAETAATATIKGLGDQ